MSSRNMCLLPRATLHSDKEQYCLVGLVGRVFASWSGDPWIISWAWPYILYRNITSEYSEIYREQLTSEPFLQYNYRSSTLPGISRNIGRPLRQCTLKNLSFLYELFLLSLSVYLLHFNPFIIFVFLSFSEIKFGAARLQFGRKIAFQIQKEILVPGLPIETWRSSSSSGGG